MRVMWDWRHSSGPSLFVSVSGVWPGLGQYIMADTSRDQRECTVGKVGGGWCAALHRGKTRLGKFREVTST